MCSQIFNLRVLLHNLTQLPFAMKSFFVLLFTLQASISVAQNNFHWEWCHGPNNVGPQVMGINRNDNIVLAQDNRLCISADHGSSWIPVTLSTLYTGFEQLAFTADAHILVLRMLQSQYPFNSDSSLLERVSANGEIIERLAIERLTFITTNNVGVTNAIKDTISLLESSDEGNSWDTISTPTGIQLLSCVKTTTGTYIIMTPNGLFRRAADSAIWNLVLPDSGNDYFNLQVDASGRIFASKSGGNIIFSEDDGVTWNLAPARSSLFPVASNKKGEAVFSSQSGSVLRVTTGLVLDTILRPIGGSIYLDSTGSWWLSGALTDSNNETISGLFLSDDSLRTWNAVSFPLTTLNSVFAHSQFLVSDSYYQLNFSTDQGQTWFARNAPIECPCNFQEDSTHRLILMSGDENGEKSYYSTDTGQTWNKFLWADGVGIGGISMAQAPNGDFYVARTVTVVKSTDQGVTWDTILPVDKIVPHLDNNLYVSVVATPHRIIVGTDSGYVWSEDGGNTWNDTVTTDELTSGLYFTSRGNTVLTQEFGLDRSTNEGATWTPLQVLGYDPTEAIFPSGAILMMTDSVYYIPAGGTNLISMNEGLSGFDLSGMSATVTSDGIPYLALPNVGVFRGSAPLNELKVQSQTIPSPAEVVFPDPASSYICVERTITAGLNVSDVLGRTFSIPIISVENGTTRFDVSHLPNGYYFAQVNSATGVVACSFGVTHQ
jgi:photosystem II stability/assembly factor-like uncharacterized protein